MQVLQVTDAQAWDSALLSMPNPHVLQSWAWGEFKSRHGWNATRLLWQRDGTTMAAASVLQRKMPRLPLALLYVPKGPALDWTQTDLVQRVLADLEDFAWRRRAFCVKVDPDVYYGEHAPSFSTRPGCASVTSSLLQHRGWRYSGEQIQYCNTVLLDLSSSEDELLAAMKQKTRYNVRLAARRGVTIRQGTAADLDTFFRLYAETSQRDGFLIRPQAYYDDAWGSFLDAGLAQLLLAEVEGETVAGLILFTFGPTAWYMYGASSSRYRRHMPNNLLHWEAIRQTKDAGSTLYDLWGAPDQLDESDPMWGVVRFKLGLGGQLAQGLGAWDFPASRTAYLLYSVILPRYVSWLQRRHDTQPAVQAGL
jgi:lipid II:glycine glycyltransferase (peptidoglycan interpeptide bridge formation enzyme)